MTYASSGERGRSQVDWQTQKALLEAKCKPNSSKRTGEFTYPSATFRADCVMARIRGELKIYEKGEEKRGN